jgi:hypothetical protein
MTALPVYQQSILVFFGAAEEREEQATVFSPQSESLRALFW